MVSSVKKQIAKVVVLSLFAVGVSVQADYSQHDMTAEFVEKMVSEHGFEKDHVTSLLKKAEKKQSILDAISRPAEKTKQWHEYRNIFLGQKRIDQGVQFWQEHAQTIDKASKHFGVAPEIIVAIIGVETRYGRYAGKYRVLDALATLGFDYPKRGKFFRGQLEHYMLMVREQKLDAESLTGSYAGAMGYGQFIPSSYRSYAVDFDGDKLADIWQNPVDAIGSVANYFKAHKWRDGEPVLSRARFPKEYDPEILNQKGKPTLSLLELEQKGFNPTQQGYAPDLNAKPLVYHGKHGKEFWLGFHNFYVITRYNRSHLYAMAVWQLSQEIKAKHQQL